MSERSEIGAFHVSKFFEIDVWFNVLSSLMKENQFDTVNELLELIHVLVNRREPNFMRLFSKLKIIDTLSTCCKS